MNKYYIIGLIAIVLIGGWFALQQSTPSGGLNEDDVNNIISRRLQDINLGATPGPDRSNPRECMNGLCQIYKRVLVNTGTSTLCVSDRVAATSTLEQVRVQPRAGQGTSTAFYLLLERTTRPYAPAFSVATTANVLNATTTTEGNLVQTYPASVTSPFVWNATTTAQVYYGDTVSTRNDNISLGSVFGPGDYAVVYGKSGVISQAGTGNVWGGGSCSFLFSEF